MFAITPSGTAALVDWLERPSGAPTELRDLGLLQLFFADQVSPEARLRLAEQQLAIHRAKLAAYQQDERLGRVPRKTGRGQRTAERWRGETLRMGLLYESAAVEFWTRVVATATIS
jgi:PadR family transcriptional regulator AphA